MPEPTLYDCAERLRINPNDGETFMKYLGLVRPPAGTLPPVIDISSSDGLIERMRKSDPKEVLEDSLGALQRNRMDLNAVYRLGRAAQRAKWVNLAEKAYLYVKGFSPAVKSNPERRKEIDFALGSLFYENDLPHRAFEVLGKYGDNDKLTAEERQLVKNAAAASATKTYAGDGRKEGKTKTAAVTPESEKLQVSPPQAEQERISLLESKLQNPETPENAIENVALELVKVYSTRKDYAAAEEVVKKAIARKESTVLHRAVVDIELEKLEQGIVELQSGRKPGLEDPSEIERIVGEKRVERLRYAIDGYAWLVDRPDRSDEYIIRFGEYLHELGTFLKANEPEEAKKIFKRAIPTFQRRFKSEDNAVRSGILLAECFVELGYGGAAEFVAEQILRKVADKEERKDERISARYLLAKARELQGDTVAAKQAYGQVVAEEMDFKDALERLEELSKVQKS